MPGQLYKCSNCNAYADLDHSEIVAWQSRHAAMLGHEAKLEKVK